MNLSPEHDHTLKFLSTVRLNTCSRWKRAPCSTLGGARGVMNLPHNGR